MKFCPKCNISKEYVFFNKNKKTKDNFSLWCKECNKEYFKNYYIKNKEILNNNHKQYYEKNTDVIIGKSKDWKSKNKDHIETYYQEYYQRNKEIISLYKKNHYVENKKTYLNNSINWKSKNKELYLSLLKKWRDDNKEYNGDYLIIWRISNKDKLKEYSKKRRLNNPHIVAWRNVLYSVATRTGLKKSDSTLETLKYSASDLKSHMESLFKEGMSWENWGKWHIDHKIPVSKFNKNTPICIVNALSNLQPLWAYENLTKSNKIINE